MTSRFLATFLIASGVVLMGDSEFDHVVKAIETHYHAKRTHIPFLGLANVVVKVAHPAGASEFKLALFEDLGELGDVEDRELDRFMHDLGSSHLHPLVRVHSHRDREAVYIFATDEGRETRMLIATFQSDQATVIQVRVDMNELLKWIDSPKEASSHFGKRDDDY